MKVRLLDAERTKSRLKKLILQSRGVKIGVYSVQTSGLSIIMDDLVELMSNGGSFSLLIGYRSAPDIIDEIRKLEEIKPIQIGLYDESTFHSKIYIFRLKDNGVTSIVGSSNLTESALSRNIETNVEIQGFRKLEETYDRLFEEAEKNRKTIERRLRKWAEMNRSIDKSEKNLERKSRETTEGKSYTRLWKMLDEQLEQIHDAGLRSELRLRWLGTERKMATRFRRKSTRNGKKAWLRYRLYFVLTKVILNPAKRLNVNEKASLFRAIAEYTLIDSDLTKERFSKRPLRGLISTIKRRKLERTFTAALWSRRKHGRRLFRKMSWVL